MRALLPEPLASPDLHAWYGRDWVDAGGVRVNFIASVDGAASVAGLSRGLQTPGDNQVFAVLRDLADVVLVGRGTARAEGYSTGPVDGRRRNARRTHGLAESLPIAVVSRSLDLDPAAPLFARAPAGARTLVVTCAASPAGRRAALAEVADVLIAGTDSVDLRDAVGQLHARGLRRILCEGGPSLFGELSAVRGVDELCLTVSPVLAGAGAGRILTGPARPPESAAAPTPLVLAGLLEEDGALFCRYRTQPA